MMGLLGGAQRFPGLLDDPRRPHVSAPANPGPQIVQQAGMPDARAPQIKPGPLPLRDRLMDAANVALGGRMDPKLSPEQNQQAQQQARLMAGLQMLAASGPSAQPVGLGQILAQGAMAGQQTGAQERERLYLGTQEERLEAALQDPEVMGRLTPEQRRLVRLLPPQEAVGLLTKVAFSPPPERKTSVVQGALVDDSTGEVIYQSAPESEFSTLPSDFRAIAASHGVNGRTWDQMPVEQRQAMLGRYEDFKRASATQVNLGAPDQVFANTNTLAGQFRGDIKEFQEVASAYGRVLVSGQDPSPAGDIALIFNYMKMLDPGSTVREGEFATAEQAGSIPQRLVSQYNKLVTDKGRLSEDQRGDFVDRAQRLAEQKRAQAQPVLRRYRGRAESVGLDPSTLIFDPFAEIGVEPPQAPANPFAGLIPGGGQ